MIRRKLLSLFLALIMLLSILPAGASAERAELLPPMPDGFEYYGECLTDEYGNTVYYISQTLGDSGVARGYWVDENGNPTFYRNCKVNLIDVGE